ncbi:hypothetical protein EAO71_16510 [Streptomyces sp. ms191]|nr:hypothetical protein EAO71_16510 [Streptomyces sp. ms191]
MCPWPRSRCSRWYCCAATRRSRCPAWWCPSAGCSSMTPRTVRRACWPRRAWRCCWRPSTPPPP